MRTTDPARMSSEEILAELGEILAVGAQRHISSSMRHAEANEDAKKELDDDFASEAPCGEPKETPA